MNNPLIMSLTLKHCYLGLNSLEFSVTTTHPAMKLQLTVEVSPSISHSTLLL